MVFFVVVVVFLFDFFLIREEIRKLSEKGGSRGFVIICGRDEFCLTLLYKTLKDLEKIWQRRFCLELDSKYP